MTEFLVPLPPRPSEEVSAVETESLKSEIVSNEKTDDTSFIEIPVENEASLGEFPHSRNKAIGTIIRKKNFC